MRHSNGVVRQYQPMKKILLIGVGIGSLVYLSLYFCFYSTLVDRFKSTRLEQEYTFEFKEEFEELNFRTKNDGQINSILFKSDSSQGVVCFWKGNGGNLKNWGLMAHQFLKYNYDVIITDYRQHGKSNGEITIDNFYSDSQEIYDFLKTRYSESQIVIVGYSLGTSIASHLAIANQPLKTILIEPREKLRYKYLEAFFFPFPNINRFPFRTDLDIQRSKTSISIITGTKSSIHKDALKLRKLLGANDSYFEIEGANHGNILSNKDFEKTLSGLLDRNTADNNSSVLQLLKR
jgi:uncharacterized protein